MYRIAMVGAGGMATMHARCYEQMPNAEVVGVLDMREEAACKLAEAHGAQAFADVDAMIRTVKPDVVDVCVPTPWHAEYVVKAAQHRLKGIVVEKPMGRSVEDCEKIIGAAESAGIPLFVAHVLRFFPEFIAAKAQVDSGAVGNVAAVRTRRGGPFPRAWNNWYGKVEWSGGLTLDLIIHDFDWLRWTFGDVERVFAKGVAGKVEAGAEIDLDYALVTLRFKSGAVGHVEGTWADPGGFKVSFEIVGDEGLLEYNFNMPTSAPVTIAKAREEGGVVGVPVPESPMAANPYQLELAHFLDCLERGVDPDIKPRDGLEAVRISLAALESMKTGKPVAL